LLSIVFVSWRNTHRSFMIILRPWELEPSAGWTPWHASIVSSFFCEQDVSIHRIIYMHVWMLKTFLHQLVWVQFFVCCKSWI
jgi:hypothetical protein